jgi:hypothetical protein
LQEDVEAFMKNEESAEAALKRTQANYRFAFNLSSFSVLMHKLIAINSLAYSNYKMLEMKLQQNKMTLKTKLPDIEKALEMVKYLASKKVCPPLRNTVHPVQVPSSPLLGCAAPQDSEVSTHFEVNEGLFARSTLTDVNTACLWLGVRLSASLALCVRVLL